MTPKVFRSANLTRTVPNGASATHASPSGLTSERASPAAHRGRFLGSDANSYTSAAGRAMYTPMCAISCITPLLANTQAATPRRQLAPPPSAYTWPASPTYALGAGPRRLILVGAERSGQTPHPSLARQDQPAHRRARFAESNWNTSGLSP